MLFARYNHRPEACTHSETKVTCETMEGQVAQRFELCMSMHGKEQEWRQEARALRGRLQEEVVQGEVCSACLFAVRALCSVPRNRCGS